MLLHRTWNAVTVCLIKMEAPEEVKEIEQINIAAAETNSDAVPEMNNGAVDEVDASAELDDRKEILSRRKQKKLLKLAKWEVVKKQKRLNERQKYKEKRATEVASGIPGPQKLRKALKNNKMENSKNTVRVAIDFDYDEMMIDKDIAKCAKQLLRVYTLNRKSTMPIRLHYTSLRSGSKIEKALQRNDGYSNWDVKLTSESYLNIFDRESIVYLTSDSDTVLEVVDPSAAYIIGGLVDHNHHKGLSLQKAEANGLKTARLPLSEHIEMKTRTVLTIVHGMCEDMISYMRERKLIDSHVFQFTKFCCVFRKENRGRRHCWRCYRNENSIRAN